MMEFPTKLLTGLPQPIMEYCEFLNSTAYNRQPIFNLASAITGLATVLGGAVELEGWGTRTNIYILAIGKSGAGKDNALKGTRSIFASCKCSELLTAEDIISDAGMLREIREQSCCLFLLDEFGQHMKNVKNSKNQLYLQRSMDMFLKLYSSSTSAFKSPSYADKRKSFTVSEPNVSVYATSIPDNFFKSLSYDNITSGLLSRFLIFRSEKGPEESVMPSKIRLSPEFKSFVQKSRTRKKRKEILISRKAKTHFKDFNNNMLVEAKKAESRNLDSIYVRVHESALKLALIYGACREELEVDLVGAQWSTELAYFLTKDLESLCEDHISDTPFHSNLNAFVREFKAAGKQGLTFAQMLRKATFARVHTREREELLEMLKESDRIRQTNTNAGKSVKKRIAFCWNWRVVEDP